MKIRYCPNRTTPKKWVLDCGILAGKRRQLFFLTEAEAEKALRAQERDRREVGKEWAATTSKERVQNLEILAEIKAANLSLLEVWDGFKAARKYAPKTRITIEAAIDQLLKMKRAGGYRAAFIQSLDSTLKIFARGQEKRMLDTFTPQAIQQYLTRRNMPPTSLNGTIGRLQTLFTWAKKNGYVGETPMIGIERATVEMGTPATFTNEQTRLVLDAAREHAPRILPYIILGLFTGLRSREAAALTWADIDLGAAILTVNAKDSKVRRRRIVDLHPTAVEWLKTCPVELLTEKVTPGQFRTTIKRLNRILGWPGWPSNVLRHTAATHLINFYGSPEKAAYQLGTSREMLFSHYRDVVRKEVSEAFFRIMPDTTPAAITYPNFQEK